MSAHKTRARVSGSAAGFAQAIQIREHSLTGDEPGSAGGTDTGPSPVEFLLAALGSCTSMTLGMYARRKGMALRHVHVDLCHHRVHREGGGLIDQIERKIQLEGELSAEERARLIEIAEKCPVHKTLTAGVHIVTSESPCPD